jgi:hypothetical protein
MSNVLTRNTPANTRYTEFENNQVLTADQLNDLFRYLDIQSRLTRTRGIGVGIICGLEIGVTEQNNIVVSKGTAITTDGDLLFVDSDLVFDQFSEFKDANSKYDYFLVADDKQIPLFALSNSKNTSNAGKSIGQFEQGTNTALKDYVGILYQESYDNDTDLCTGTDCDNRGIECVREIKVLLAHKDQVAELLKSIPKINRNYFSLDDIDTPRVMLKNTVSKFDELRGAFASALTVKDELKSKLQKGYEVCKAIVEDDMGSTDPVKEWNELLEQHFKLQTGIYSQYVYDFARDLSYAYNEMRETLFNDNSICCPPVELFPKHVLMGLVKPATVKKPAPPVVITGQPLGRIKLLDLSTTIKFDLGSIIRRFHPVHIDIEYRHQFYESPVLNNKEENIERTKFCFKRIDAMIRNFKVPTAEELQTVENIKIIPGMFEDRNLGERAIPFYYKYNKTQPINAYWNFDANVRKRENSIYYYFSNQYQGAPLTKDPLKFNLLPYSFFRVEGHIGYKYREVQRILNKIIDENNLPINLVTVQVEREIRTIPDLNWWFPHIQLYEGIVRNNFIDHLNQAELVHTRLKEETKDDPDKTKIELAITNFTKAKEKVLLQKPVAAAAFNFADFNNDVSAAIQSATEVKVQTQKFTFSNTAAPHDFVINTDVLHKTDVLKDLFDKQIIKKKEGLFLGNFMKNNPGLEHAGGVLRGGTFVLVYTSNDEKVVADFMLPYASVDRDIVPDPPVVRPIPLPDPARPKFDLPKIFEKIPPYKRLFDDKIFTIDDKIKRFDDSVKDVNIKLGQKVLDLEDTRKILNEKAEGLDKKIGEKFKLFDETKLQFDQKVKDVDVLYTRKINDLESKVEFQGQVVTNLVRTPKVAGGDKLGGAVIAGKDFTREAEILQRLSKEIEVEPASPTRLAKEQQILEISKKVTDALNTANATVDKADELHVKALLLDIQEASEKVQANTAIVPAAGQPAITKAVIEKNTKVGLGGLNKRIIR